MKRILWKFIEKWIILVFLTLTLSAFQRVYATPQPQQIISTVNQETISIEKFQQRYQFNLWYNAILIRNIYEQGDMDLHLIESIYGPTLNLLRNPQAYGEYLLDQMEYEIVIKQAAESLGVAIEQSSIDELLQHDIESLSINSPDEFFKKAKEEVGVEQEIISEIYFYRALEQKLFAEITSDIPTEELQLHVRHILLAFNPDDPYDNELVSEQQRTIAFARAKEVVKSLENGEPFAELALSSSDDTLNAQNGGDIPWLGKSAFPPPFWEAIKDAPIGSVVGPIETQYGYHVVEILEREIRPLDPQILTQQQQEAFTVWVEKKIDDAEIDRHPRWLQYIPNSPTYEDLLGDIIPPS